MSARVLKRLAKHVIGQIAMKISGVLRSGFVGENLSFRVPENV